MFASSFNVVSPHGTSDDTNASHMDRRGWVVQAYVENLQVRPLSGLILRLYHDFVDCRAGMHARICARQSTKTFSRVLSCSTGCGHRIFLHLGSIFSLHDA